MTAVDIALDPCVQAVRTALDLDAPDAVFLLGTGAALFAEKLESARCSQLPTGEPLPARWRGRDLHQGHLGDLALWVLEDPLDLPREGDDPELDEAPWAPGFPCWLAAAAGARVCVHTSAGAALPSLGDSDAPNPTLPVGALAVLADHLNLSGRSPLVGLGMTQLGPLFPDLTQLHHAGLRSRALQRAGELGIETHEAIAACTHGPSLETAAESRWLAQAGAQVSVQGLAAPLIAAGHAGLDVLGLVAVAAQAGVPLDVAALIEKAERSAPALEDLLLSLAPDIAGAVQARRASEQL